MSKQSNKRPDYGNWVSRKLIYIPGLAALFLLAISFISYFLAIPAVIFIIISIYFGYAYYKFSPRGGDLQAKIHQLLLDRMVWNGEGKVLDIGCGSGALTIKLAKNFPNALVTGIDYWGGKWEYSKDKCEKNAQIAGVAERTVFQKASAAKLPFADESFDAVVSNFVFHEVQDVIDKREAIKEALRVLKKGRVFVFQDLFLWKRVYGEPEDLLLKIRSWGIDEVKLIDTSQQSFIPRAMKLPFMIGQIGIIHGRK
jgi:ubiquinone/menaquinone biosynthesis C-methylase UbiE